VRAAGADPPGLKAAVTLSFLLCHPNAEAARLVIVVELNAGSSEID
jgi:hypothetical protein